MSKRHFTSYMVHPDDKNKIARVGKIYEFKWDDISLEQTTGIPMYKNKDKDKGDIDQV